MARLPIDQNPYTHYSISKAAHTNQRQSTEMINKKFKAELFARIVHHMEMENLRKYSAQNQKRQKRNTLTHAKTCKKTFLKRSNFVLNRVSNSSP